MWGLSMSLLAKSIVKNKCWIVEDNGQKVGTILANPKGVVYQHDQQKEQFASLKLLSDRYNILVEKPLCNGENIKDFKEIALKNSEKS